MRLILSSILFFALIGIAGYYILGRLYLRSALGSTKVENEPACGNCGYPARGISTLECPECGADLREVGIVRPGQHGPIGSGCLVPTVFTIAAMVIAGTLLGILTQQLPTQVSRNYYIDLRPITNAGYTATLSAEYRELVPSNRHGQTSGLSSFSYGTSVRSTSSQLTFSGLPTRGSGSAASPLRRLSLHISNAGSPNPSEFAIDPQTRQATWTTANGTTQQTSGAMSPSDVLAYFADAGLASNDPDIQNQAQDLHAALDAIAAQNASSITLTRFASNGSGSSSQSQPYPTWFTPAYILTWLVLWIVGLVVITRRGRRARSGGTSAP